MKKVVLICYGRLKSAGLEEAVGEFTKRLSRYTDFKVIELNETLLAIWFRPKREKR
jgi:hypothetical protein